MPHTQCTLTTYTLSIEHYYCGTCRTVVVPLRYSTGYILSKYTAVSCGYYEPSESTLVLPQYISYQVHKYVRVDQTGEGKRRQADKNKCCRESS